MATRKIKGPIEIKYKACKECKYLDWNLGMCELHARCEHPKWKGERTIGSFDRGADKYVPTPDWCPILKKGIKHGT